MSKSSEENSSKKCIELGEKEEIFLTNRFKQVQQSSNPRFWSRLGGKPPLERAKVLEVGCGVGSLCIDMGLLGAEKVVGVDLNSRAIEFANRNLRRNYPQLTNTVEYIDVDLKDYPEFSFDCIVSKDSFEHIVNLDKVLSEIKRRLKPGGKLYAGFGPLWNSPFGLHGGPHMQGKLKSPFPWWHLLVSEARVVDKFNHLYPGNKLSSIYEIGLNKLSLSDYRRILRGAELSIIYFQINKGDGVKSKVSSLIRKIPFLEEYFSYNIYCILEKSKK